MAAVLALWSASLESCALTASIPWIWSRPRVSLPFLVAIVLPCRRLTSQAINRSAFPHPPFSPAGSWSPGDAASSVGIDAIEPARRSPLAPPCTELVLALQLAMREPSLGHQPRATYMRWLPPSSCNAEEVQCSEMSARGFVHGRDMPRQHLPGKHPEYIRPVGFQYSNASAWDHPTTS